MGRIFPLWRPARIFSFAVESVFLAMLLSGCSHKPEVAYSPPPPPAVTPETAPATAASAPPALPSLSADEQFVDTHTPIYSESGVASWYGPPYHNRQAADGSVFDQNALTAAHRTLPMGTVVRVTNLATNQSVVVKITDRGPFVAGRTLDLSLAAAKAIGVYRAGVAKVKVEAFARPGADPEGKWCVQIGVFIDAADAVQLKNDLMGRYKTAKVIEFAGPTGHWVRINPALADHATAQKIADSIHLPDADSFLVRLN